MRKRPDTENHQYSRSSRVPTLANKHQSQRERGGGGGCTHTFNQREIKQRFFTEAAQTRTATGTVPTARPTMGAQNRMINPTPAGATPARLTLKIERVFIAYAPLQHPNRNTPNICTSYIDACRRRDPPKKNKQTCDSFPTPRPAHNHGRWYSMHLLPAQQQDSGAAAHSKSSLSSRFFSRYRARVVEARPPFIHSLSVCRTCKTAITLDSCANLGLRLFLERSSSPGPLYPTHPTHVSRFSPLLSRGRKPRAHKHTKNASTKGRERHPKGGATHSTNKLKPGEAGRGGGAPRPHGLPTKKTRAF